jgi:hypothetical protein
VGDSPIGRAAAKGHNVVHGEGSSQRENPPGPGALHPTGRNRRILPVFPVRPQSLGV